MAGWNTTKHAPRAKRSPKLVGRRWPDAGANLGARDWPAALLKVVDAALGGVIFVSPLALGGRHDIGRFVLAALASVAGVVWFARQTLVGRRTKAAWPVIALLAASGLMLLVQVVPLPAALVPSRIAELLPLWSGAEGAGSLGTWRTISLEPEATRLALAMWAAYALLTVTVLERVETEADAMRLVRWVGLSAGVMAAIGVVQHALPNGKFLWTYQDPTRDAGDRMSGPFVNANHFAHFLALGAPALVAWLIVRLQSATAVSEGDAGGGLRIGRFDAVKVERWISGALGAALALVAFAAFASCSRGGALALGTSIAVVGLILFRAGLLRQARLGVLAAAGVAVFLAVSLVGYDDIAERLSSLTAESLEELDSTANRRRIWQANVAAIGDGGWWGSGAGTHIEITPVYLDDPPTATQYTHAESGYLQVLTENGAPGGVLLIVGFGLAGWACQRAVRRASSPQAKAYAGACVAALAASGVHSIVDFVWYIPACLATTLVLAACAWRLGEVGAGPVAAATSPNRIWGAGATSWGAAAGVAAAFAVSELVGPARVAPHWDAYLRMVASSRAYASRVREWPAEVAIQRRIETLNVQLAADESMIAELEQVVRARTAFAPAHRLLANRYVALFHLRQELADSPLPLAQVRDAAIQSQFSSTAALGDWLGRAFGEQRELLYRAWLHARTAARLSPLEGEPYLRLAELCFLAGQGFPEVDAYLEQAVRVRPYDGDLLFEAGTQWASRGIVEPAAECWMRAFRLRGLHRLRLARCVAGEVPTKEAIEMFAPEWDTLPEFWRACRTPEDGALLLAYAEEQAQREAPTARPSDAAKAWRSLAMMQQQAGRPDAALGSLARACEASPDDFESRRQLGLALCAAGRYGEAEGQLRWCQGRRDRDHDVEGALKEIERVRYARQSTTLR